jgi:hypothetical protein
MRVSSVGNMLPYTAGLMEGASEVAAMLPSSSLNYTGMH